MPFHASSARRLPGPLLTFDIAQLEIIKYQSYRYYPRSCCWDARSVLRRTARDSVWAFYIYTSMDISLDNLQLDG